ncbi:MAG: hypothetical protein R2800_05155 [Flavipsychrobacter sp.]
MNNLIRKIPRITHLLFYIYLSVFIISLLVRIQHWPNYQEIYLICIVLGALLVSFMSIEIMTSQLKITDKLLKVASIVVPITILAILKAEALLALVALSGFIYMRVVRKKVFPLGKGYNRPSS